MHFSMRSLLGYCVNEAIAATRQDRLSNAPEDGCSSLAFPCRLCILSCGVPLHALAINCRSKAKKC
jgi:hypothetical protein